MFFLFFVIRKLAVLAGETQECPQSRDEDRAEDRLEENQSLRGAD